MKNTTNSDNALVWKEVGKRELLRTCVMTVTERDCVSFDGQTGKYIVMDVPDWVIVIPEVEDGNEKSLLVVKQWRHGEKALSTEFPGGVAEKGEKAEDAAARELLEETGAVAGRLTHLGTMNPNPALMSNHVHVFLAQELKFTGHQSLDEDERLNYFKMSIKSVMQSAATPACPHALMTAALALYMIHESRE